MLNETIYLNQILILLLEGILINKTQEVSLVKIDTRVIEP